jgi:hypothetical protein
LFLRRILPFFPAYVLIVLNIASSLFVSGVCPDPCNQGHPVPEHHPEFISGVNACRTSGLLPDIRKQKQLRGKSRQKLHFHSYIQLGIRGFARKNNDRKVLPVLVNPPPPYAEARIYIIHHCFTISIQAQNGQCPCHFLHGTPSTVK